MSLRTKLCYLTMDNKSLCVILAVYCVVSSLFIDDVHGNTNCTYSGIQKSILTCEDTIPSNISKQTKTVFIRGFSTVTVLSNLTFQGAWENITSLDILSNNTLQVVFRTHCLRRLKNLMSLTVIVKNIVLEKRVFYGLNSLEHLTLPNTHLLSEQEILNSLNSSDLENLKNLRFSRIENNPSSRLELGDWFWKFVGTVSLVSLDISGMNVTSFNLTSFNANCQRLIYIKLYETRFMNVHMTTNEAYVLSNNNLNMMISPRTIVEKIKVWCPEYKTYYQNSVDLGLTDYYFKHWVNVVTIENMCSANFNVLSIRGFNFISGPKLTFKQTWNITSLFITQSQFKGPCKGSIITSSTLLRLSLSKNHLIFLCPDVISNIITLRYLILSFNHLENMNVRHKQMFERLFFTLQNLEDISLKSNFLTHIPENIFLKNDNLKRIDLSHNHLSKVTFKIDHLKSLEYLNLRRNMISTLDGSAMMQLDNILNTQTGISTSVKLRLNIWDNPLDCSSCKSYAFITWLQKQREFLRNSVPCCRNEDKTLEYLFNKRFYDDCVIQVDEEKERERNIIVVVLALVLLPALMIISAKVLRTYLDKRKGKHVPEEFVKQVQIENKEHEYLVFLAFSSEDDSFINEEVVPSLTPRLLTLVHNVKPLCIGDTAFRLGKYIHDEIITCLEKSKVVLVLLTNNYCRSRYCMMEFQKATYLDKPVIFMVKDKVDEQLMTPAMRLHYNHNTRIIWAKENGKYVLKSTWARICESIIELASKEIET